MKTNANSGMVIVSVLVLLALCGSVSAVDGNDLVSHWKFDEGSGTTAYDSAGSNDGTVYGATWTTGHIEGALSFDGADDYVDVGDPIDESLDFGAANSFSISAWIKSNKDYSPIVHKRRCTGPGGVHYEGYDFTWSSEKLYFAIEDTSSGYTQIFGNTIVSDDQWHHVAAVRDTAEDKLYLYADGSPDATPLTDNTTATLATSTSFHIGHRDLTAPPGYVYYEGTMDDVRIYNIALSAEEIWQLYQEGLPSLVAIDIKPQSCPNPLNLKSRGVLPVAVLGSEYFDVNNIDVASIRLADIAPIRSSFEDVATPVADGNECECTAEGPDGYTDLTLKFKTQEIVEKLINAPGKLLGGQTLSLTLTGALSDGTLIEGTDCVLLVGNVPRAIAAKRADINGDGVVDFRDLTIVSNYWLESSEIE